MPLLSHLNFLTCSNHTNQYVTHFCLAQDCQDRILCAECKKDHPYSHLLFLTPLRSFATKDIQQEINTTKHFLQETHNKTKKMISRVDSIFDQLRKEFEDTLSIIRAEIFIEVTKLQGEIDGMRHLTEQIENCLSKPTTLKDVDIEKLLTAYAHYKKDLKALRDNSHSLTSKRLWSNEKVEDLCVSLQTSYKEMENFFMDELDVNNLKLESEVASDYFWGASCIEVLDTKNLLIVSSNTATSFGVISVFAIKEKGFKKISSLGWFEPVSQLRFYERNSYILANSLKGVISVLKLSHSNKCSLIKRINVDPERIYDSLLIHDQGKLVTSGSCGLTVWDLQRITYERRIQKVHSSPVTSLVYITKHNVIGLFYAHFKQISLIDFNTNKEVAIIQCDSSKIQSNESETVSMLYLEKKDVLVVGRISGKIKWWSLENISKPVLLQEKQLEGSSSGRIKIMPLLGEEKIMFTSNTMKLYQLDLISGFMKESQKLTLTRYDNFAFIPRIKLFILFLDMGLYRPLIKA